MGDISYAIAGAALSVNQLPYIAIAISIATFAAAQRESRRRAKVDYVNGLEERISECERDRTDLRTQVKQYRDENLDLLRRVMRLEGPTP